MSGSAFSLAKNKEKSRSSAMFSRRWMERTDDGKRDAKDVVNLEFR